MNFKEKVAKVVKEIPKGKVVSYGQVAAACGSPRAARQVGWMLRYLGDTSEIPWWRVINNQGVISIKGDLGMTPLAQKKNLEKENVAVSKDLKIDIEKYRYFFRV